MFDQLKNLGKMREIQNILSKERVTVERDGIKVTVNGKMEMEEIILSPDMEKGKQERILKDCINEAVKKIQFSAAQKMSQMGGF
ncbi:MAG: hypothetical protein COX37_02235 [Candidatus Nealsonbacteria bacterium CG23_combo_of_CG06-09_8_20_14_all_39_17]|uniref:Nucleoid-associated protein, YbaB/EbfC family n=1 Tax=Candidatus Nealsonbacteria bacterium CG23_combo_of_CG06-09_8_20_14_all_39_17 TaxID=1974722 RepID=A0A2G9YU72_9BACT|nr:MAG: hypothetical protein COX37_02235 [Candidatus Nealsonbacteria bacterium CG23_combo_of_CG06-09_8_20_14_all_39_17]